MHLSDVLTSRRSKPDDLYVQGTNSGFSVKLSKQSNFFKKLRRKRAQLDEEVNSPMRTPPGY